MRLLKTVIGSFPPLSLSVDDAIKAYLKLQLEHGIDIVSEGEPRGNMIQCFSQIPGLTKTPRGLRVAERIKPMEDPSEFVKVKDFEFLKSLLEGQKAKNIQTKIAITGPVTLGFFSATEGVDYYGGMVDPRLYQDLAFALKPLLLELLSRGALVQIDEPVLSQMILPVDKAISFLNLMLEDVPEHVVSEGKLSIHVCGPLRNMLFEQLLSINVSTLSLAFSSKTDEGNIHVLSKDSIEKGNKRIGLGCVSVLPVSVDEVDQVSTITRRIQVLMHKIGYHNIAYIHPDCGLRSTPQPVAEKILESLRLAAEEVQKFSE